jgi:hypothetical protein
MDLGFGGPVWHASVRTYGNQRDDVARLLALRALNGVGDESLGQWELGGRSAFHIRRRLSIREQVAAGLAMRDIRGTQEAKERARAVYLVVPRLRAFAMTEIGAA